MAVQALLAGWVPSQSSCLWLCDPAALLDKLQAWCQHCSLWCFATEHQKESATGGKSSRMPAHTPFVLASTGGCVWNWLLTAVPWRTSGLRSCWPPPSYIFPPSSLGLDLSLWRCKLVAGIRMRPMLLDLIKGFFFFLISCWSISECSPIVATAAQKDVTTIQKWAETS